MNNNNNNKEILLSDILFRLISPSKLLLIVVITLLFTVSSYLSKSNQKVKHESKALIEIGTYNSLGENSSDEFYYNTRSKLIESPKKLLDEINFQVEYNKEFTAPGSFTSSIISPKVIQISIQTLSSDKNKKYLESLLKHIFDRHNEIISRINSQRLERQKFVYEILSNSSALKEKKLTSLRSKNNLDYKSAILIMQLEDEISNLKIKLHNMNLAINSLKNGNFSNLVEPISKRTIYQNVKKTTIKGMISGFMLSLFLVFIYATYSAYKEQEVQ